MGFLGSFSPETMADFARWKRAQPRRRPRVRVRRPVFRFRLDRDGARPVVRGVAFAMLAASMIGCTSIRDVRVIDPGRTATATVRWWGFPPDLGPAIDSAATRAGIGCVTMVRTESAGGWGWKYRVTVTGRP